MKPLEEIFSTAKTFHRTGNLSRAEQLYRHVVQLDSGYVDAWQFLGALLQNQKRLVEAVECYLQVLRFRPLQAETNNNLAVIYAYQKNQERACFHFEQAIRAQPDRADAVFKLISLYQTNNEYEKIAHCLGSFLELMPNHVEALHRRGVALVRLGKHVEGEINLRRAIDLKPDYANAWNHLGIAYLMQKKYGEAVACFEQALILNPRFAEAIGNMGNAYRELGYQARAMDCYRNALELNPEFVDAMHNLGVVLHHKGQCREASRYFRKVLQIQSDYQASHEYLANQLFFANYDPHKDPAELFEDHRLWGDLFTTGKNSFPIHPDDLCRPLRVGYFSPDFRSHPVASFLLPILTHHDKKQFDVFCYAEVAKPDYMTHRLQALAPHWRSTDTRADAEVAAQITRDNIDILVDLAGHSLNGRMKVFALKPAPIQVTYLGYPNTTGLAAVDYRLTDAVADPPGEPVLYSEKLVRLADGFCCYAPPEHAPVVAPLPALSNGFITFGSLHGIDKINALVFDLWAEIARAIPKSRFLFMRTKFVGSVKRNLYGQMRKRGISAERIEIQNVIEPGKSYLEVYQRIDISLDTFPWNGHTTTCESLWMGSPVLTLYGNRHAGRMAASVLTRIGLTDWITRSPREYFDTAVAMSRNLENLSKLRSGLRDRMRTSPLLDGKKFTQILEKAYREMWHAWCRGGDSR